MLQNRGYMPKYQLVTPTAGRPHIPRRPRGRGGEAAASLAAGPACVSRYAFLLWAVGNIQDSLIIRILAFSARVGSVRRAWHKNTENRYLYIKNSGKESRFIFKNLRQNNRSSHEFIIFATENNSKVTVTSTFKLTKLQS